VAVHWRGIGELAGEPCESRSLRHLECCLGQTPRGVAGSMVLGEIFQYAFGGKRDRVEYLFSPEVFYTTLERC
jgi:hypothetical protein